VTSIVYDECWRVIRINIDDVTLHADAIHGGAGQIMPAAKNKLQHQLDRASDSVTGQTEANSKGCFTDLYLFYDNQFSDASDIAAKRDLLRKFVEFRMPYRVAPDAVIQPVGPCFNSD